MNPFFGNDNHEYYYNFQHGIKDILLYKGDFNFKTKKGNIIECNGEIHFKWNNISGIIINCTLKKYPEVEADYIFNQFNEINVISINKNEEIGKLIPNEYSQSINELRIRGVFSQENAFEKIKGINSFKFCITNLLLSNYDFETAWYSNLLTLQYKKFTIEINKVKQFSEQELIRNSEGEVRVTHICVISKLDNKLFDGNEVKQLLEKITLFLSFINGRYINIGLFQCWSNEVIIFNDFSLNEIHSFKSVKSWYFKMKSNDFTNIWENLIKMSPSEFEVFKWLRIGI
ncbi:MAG TPA: hypothetical protein VK175_16800 [Leadbetterella sp.]|nr:hypothetical protein [Leadbetterella sp.]